jgi:hypothetical protein
MRAGHEPSPDERRITTAKWALDRAAEIGSEAAQAISKLGVRVIGDISLLGTMPPGRAQAQADAASESPLDSADSACQAVIGAIVAGGATCETPGIEDLQVRDADVATLVRVLKKRGLRRARRSLHRGM